MRLTIGSYEVMVRRARKPRSKRVTYCRSYEQLSEAVRAAGIDIWQDKDSFRRACANAGIEVDTASSVYFLEAPVILRNAELDGKPRLEKLLRAIVAHLVSLVDRHEPYVRPFDRLKMKDLAGGGWTRQDVKEVLDEIVSTRIEINGKRLRLSPDPAVYVLLSADLPDENDDEAMARNDAAVLKMLG